MFSGDKSREIYKKIIKKDRIRVFENRIGILSLNRGKKQITLLKMKNNTYFPSI